MKFGKFIKTRSEKFGSVIFDTLKEKVYVTNTTGSDILKLLKENKTEEEIISTLKNSYQDETWKIKNDVVLFLEGLKINNILV